MFNSQRIDDLEDLIYLTGESMLENKEQIEYLTKSDTHNLWLFDQMTTKIKELEENLRLVYEYLGVRKEVLPAETLLVDDDCCDECSFECENNWEEIEKDKKTNKK